MEGSLLLATGVLFELSWLDIFPLEETFMEGGTDDLVYLPVCGF